MKSFGRSFFFSAASVAALAMPVRAEMTIDWNNQALNAIQSNSVEAPEAARDLAMLSTAMYEAINGIDGGFTSYLPGDTGGPVGADQTAAAAAAANTILEALYPAMGSSFTTLYADELAALPATQATTDGVNWGNQVAQAILNARASDGSANAASTPYSPSGQLGRWAPTPVANGPGYQNPPTLPGWGNVVPFAMTSGSQFRPTTTVDITSAAYANAFNQVQSLGSINSSTRTAAQTASAYSWAAPTGTVTAAGQWNQIATQIIHAQGLDLRTQARILAQLNIAIADASISAYDATYVNDNWRPVTAIAYGGDNVNDTDGNPLTTGDEFWNPLIDTPPLPSYANVNTAIAGAAVKVLKAYFGNHSVSIMMDTNGDGVPDTLVTYATLDDALAAAGLAPILAGTDFSYSTDAGLALGNDAGGTAIQLFQPITPVPEPSGAVLLVAVGALMSVGRRRK